MDVLYQWLQNNVRANKAVLENCCRGFGVSAIVSPSRLNRFTVQPPGGSGEVSGPTNKFRALIHDSPSGT